MDNLRELIKESLESHLDKSLILKEGTKLSEALQYHIDNALTLTNNVLNELNEPELTSTTFSSSLSFGFSSYIFINSAI